ncbi:hypothetical protein GCM10009672_16000 [Nesterenkonia lutea]
MSSRETRTFSVAIRGVEECPEPTGRSTPPVWTVLRTSPATAASSRGRRSLRAVKDTLPDQFVNRGSPSEQASGGAVFICVTVLSASPACRTGYSLTSESS